MAKKLKGNPGGSGNKPITPVPAETGKHHAYADKFSRTNMTPVIHYGH